MGNIADYAGHFVLGTTALFLGGAFPARIRQHELMREIYVSDNADDIWQSYRKKRLLTAGMVCGGVFYPWINEAIQSTLNLLPYVNLDYREVLFGGVLANAITMVAEARNLRKRESSK